MKPAPFTYEAPTTLDAALAALAAHGGDAKLLAGGQSLVPVMNFRLAQPAHLIDLNRVAGLDGIAAAADGGLRLGALVRQRTLEHDPRIAAAAPLLAGAAPFIAHPQIRNRGTLGGSLAHADPAAELPAVAVALGARLRLQRQDGERWVEAEQFYVGLFASVLEPDEILTEVALDAPAPRTGWAFHELARRSGDYAQVGVAATLTLDAAGRCAAARLVYLSVGDGPLRARRAEAVLHGERPSPELFRAAAELAAAEEMDPAGDIHASANYKRHLARVLGARALGEAARRAAEGQR